MIDIFLLYYDNTGNYLESIGGTEIAHETSSSSEPVKTFKDLILEVHNRGLCGSCGGCVSFCSAGELMAIGIGDNGNPKYINEDNCLECGICYLICPNIDTLDKDIKETYYWKPPIGSFKRIVTVRSTNPEILKVCTDGGVITAILHCLLEKKAIDGSIVSKKTAQFGREPMIATTYEEILHAAGSRFTGGGGVEELRIFTTYSPTMYAIKQIVNLDLIKIAVVGTPCQVHTLRKMQNLSVVPSHVVKFVLGLFCSENFSFDVSKIKEVEDVLGINLDDIEKLNIREDLIVKLANGEKKHIPLENMEKFTRPACLACSDFTNEYADISFGGLGSPEGWTTIIIRTEAGERIYHEALHHGYIEEFSEMQEETDKYYAAIRQKLIQFSNIKRDRALKNKEGSN